MDDVLAMKPVTMAICLVEMDAQHFAPSRQVSFAMAAPQLWRTSVIQFVGMVSASTKLVTMGMLSMLMAVQKHALLKWDGHAMEVAATLQTLASELLVGMA
jgi:hypothetical protein